MNAALELGSTWSLRAHYAREFGAPKYGNGPGRESPAICNGSIWLYDEVGINAYGKPGYYRKGGVRLAELPLCVRCAGKAGPR